jgi:hypothetical protein
MPKEEFLLAAIQDCQENIRFIESKATLCSTAVGGFYIWVLSNADDLSKHWIMLTWNFKLTFWALAITSIMTLVILKLMIFPRINPQQNIKVVSGGALPKSLWYIGENKYHHSWFRLGFLVKGKLKTSLSTLKARLNSSEFNIEEQLIFELAKLNFIRNIKNDYFKPLRFWLVISGVLFCCLVWQYFQYTFPMTASGN